MGTSTIRSVAAAVSETLGEGARAATRGIQAIAGLGLHARPLSFERDRVVLLFFADVERDTLVPGDRHLRRAARRLKRAFRDGQKVSGFGVAVDRMVQALVLRGCRVVINDRPLARRNPTYPVALTGYPHLLDGWDLPNPAILGPGLLDHPGLRPELMSDRRFRWYLTVSPWTQALFETAWPGRTFLWFSGVDVAAWPETPSAQKDLDLLVYEKFLWDQQANRARLLQPILAELQRRGLRVHHVRYGQYDHAEYRALLARSRGLLFLCEHETQGMAYQEALASGVPILAWDQGEWLDPLRLRFGDAAIPASSVPWFSPECGERFRDLPGFAPALDAFLLRLDRYRPRAYAAENLSLERSADLYLEKYGPLAPE